MPEVLGKLIMLSREERWVAGPQFLKIEQFPLQRGELLEMREWH